MDNIEKDIAQGYADFADDEGSIEEVETEENIVTENSTSFSFEETTNFSEMSDINRKLRTYFDGKIVRKDLTKSIKEGANVPVYVLEFLLGQYCSSDDPSIIEEECKKNTGRQLCTTRRSTENSFPAPSKGKSYSH